MKKIKLSEEQLNMIKLLIKEEEAPNFDGGDVKEFGDSSESGKIAPECQSDEDGTLDMGSANQQLGAYDRLAAQNYFLSSMHGAKGF